MPRAIVLFGLILSLVVFGGYTRSAMATVTASMGIDSTSATITISTSGDDGEITFTGVAGDEIGMAVTNVSIGSSSCCGAIATVRKPDGSYLHSASVGTNDSEHDLPTLPVSGTYTIFVDPQGTNTGSATFLLSRDVTAAAGTADSEWDLIISRRGQNARVQFTGSAGTELHMGADNVTIGTSTCCSLLISILKPNGSNLTTKAFGTNGGSIAIPALPTSGTYTLVVDPAGASTGSITVSLPKAKPIPGPLYIKWFSFDNASCGDDYFVDPVNVIFYGDGVSDFLARTRNHVNHHTGWGENFPSQQYFSTNGTCVLNEFEYGSAAFFQTRSHLRLKVCDPAGLAPSCDSTNAVDNIVLGGAHFEDITNDGDCSESLPANHAVRETVAGWSGFDEGRRKVYNMMFRSHFTYEKYVGNTREAIQCDGGLAESNGYVRFVRIPPHTH